MLGFYVHVPFCSVRCGYCDFNTYTSDELGGASAPAGASRATYADAALAEVHFARGAWPDEDRPVSTVFFGGGTPTVLPPEDLTGILGGIDAEFGLASDPEVTTEANPDSVSAEDLVRLREGGVNRISFGMQSAVRPVLAVLDRTHDPERVPRVVEWARAAGFDQVSLDLIYGTPGESLEDWSTSLDAALACTPDHVSAYSLVVEQGTALARRVRRGEVAAVDDDDLADKYVLADERLTAAGLGWYEVSNWARDEAARCRHNLGYWRGDDWWGVGPGAHSHRDGVRWWNVKHPAEYARRLAAGTSPEAEREVLTPEERHEEALLLGIRLAEGLDASVLSSTERDRLPELARRALLTETDGRVRLSREGRLLADGVVRDLLD